MEKEEKQDLTKEAFEKLLTKAAQPKKKPSTEAERTSESRHSGD